MNSLHTFDQLQSNMAASSAIFVRLRSSRYVSLPKLPDDTSHFEFRRMTENENMERAQ